MELKIAIELLQDCSEQEIDEAWLTWRQQQRHFEPSEMDAWHSAYRAGMEKGAALEREKCAKFIESSPRDQYTSRPWILANMVRNRQSHGTPPLKD